MVVEIVTALLVLVLALVTVIAAYIGVLGAVGALRWVRCTRCDHYGITSGLERSELCSRCRHQRLFHPLYALRHAHLAFWSQHAAGRHG